MTWINLELIELIVDLASDDKTTLCTCAFVARAWLPRVQHHLFAEVLVRDLARSSTLLALLDARPTLAPQIRALHAWAGHGANQAPWFYAQHRAGLLGLLGRLPRLRALAMHNLNWPELERAHGPRPLHTRLLPGLQALALSACVLLDDAGFADFLVSLPVLRDLELVWPAWSPAPNAGTMLSYCYLGRLQLKSFAVRACWGEPSHRLWVDTINSSTLTALEVTLHSRTNVERWQPMLDAACESLERLTVVEAETSPTSLDLRQLARLRKLCVTSNQAYNARAPHRNADPLAAFVRLLRSTRSPALAEASLVFEKASAKLLARAAWPSLCDTVRDVSWLVRRPHVVLVLDGDRSEIMQCKALTRAAVVEYHMDWLQLK